MLKNLTWSMLCGLVISLTQTIDVSAQETTNPFARWEPVIAKFEEGDNATPPRAGGVLFVGSSSIRLWNLEKSFPGMQAVNRGFGGSEVADSVHFFERIIVPHKPRVIVLYAGDNDLSKGKTPCRVHGDVIEFLGKVEQHLPETRVVFIAVKPSIRRWEMVHKVRAVNALVNATAVDNERLAFVDVDAPMLGTDGRPRQELFVQDGLHLSEAGYKVWAELVRPHLSE